MRVCTFPAIYKVPWVKCTKVIHLHMLLDTAIAYLGIEGNFSCVNKHCIVLSAPLSANAQLLVKNKDFNVKNKGINFNQPLWICTRTYLGDSC